MKKIFTGIMIACFLGLVGCQHTQPSILKTEYVVVDIPTSFYYCPQLASEKIPNPETLTNEQLAGFITILVKYNKACGISMKSIRKFEAQGKKLIEARNAGLNK